MLKVGTCIEVWKTSSPGVVGAGLGSGIEAGSTSVFTDRAAEELLLGAVNTFRGLRLSIVNVLSMLRQTEGDQFGENRRCWQRFERGRYHV